METPRSIASQELSYNDYLKIPEMLNLQHPVSQPAHHDEMLFIIIHQSYELWFKLMKAELELAMNELEKGEALRALHYTERASRVMKMLVGQIHILETMDPVEFLAFRDRLNPASGFQSLQFREIEFMCGLKDQRYLQFFKNRPEMLQILENRLKNRDLRQSYFRCLSKLGFSIKNDWIENFPYEDEKTKIQFFEVLLPVYQQPKNHLPLYLLSESLVDLDSELSFWREHHVRVVERLIGFKRGTGGSSGVSYLQSTTSKKAFPLLWEIRSHLRFPESSGQS